MHEIQDAPILCSSLKQTADHIGRIKPLWQHPIYPSMTLEAQSGVFVRSLTPVYENAPRSLPYNVKSQQPAYAACTCSAVTNAVAC